MLRTIKKITNNQFFGFAIFWLFFYAILILQNYKYFPSVKEVAITWSGKMVIMIICSLIFIHIFIPLYQKKKFLLLIISFLMSLYLINMMFQGWKIYFVEANFPETHKWYIKHGKGFWGRVNEPIALFLRTPLYYYHPTLFILMIRYFKSQKKIAKINEQKKEAEITALKRQLNPHFLFNTLNNIYSLALQKSEKTPEVIAQLADILDYVIYKCNDTFVDLENEIKLLEDYIKLEKIRYDSRFELTFDKKIEGKIKIAPLILLSFLENSFKHGVSQELNVAKINLSIEATAKNLLFRIENTVPEKYKTNRTSGLGIKNAEKQLKLLYKNNYNLNIERNSNHYIVNLELKLI